MQISHNTSLLVHNTFGMHAKADMVFVYDSPEQLVATLCRTPFPLCRPLLHIGEGSNLLFRGDYHGTILMSRIQSLDVLQEHDGSVSVRVGAGWHMDDFIQECIRRGWYGLENLSAIPGQVGAAAVQNIGAYGVEAGDMISAVHCISLLDGSHLTLRHDECRFAYRHSIFKTPEFFGRYAVTHVDFTLSLEFCPQLSYGGILSTLHQMGIDAETVSASQLREVIVSIRQSKLPDPKEYGNAGSFFMNPHVGQEKYERIRSLHPDVPSYHMSDGSYKIPAAWLIEKCGWKGKTLGRAGVHERQPLVLVNLGGATAQEIETLARNIITDVKEKFDIDIRPEVLYV